MRNFNAYARTGLVLAQDCALSGAGSLLSVLLVRWCSEPILGFTTLVLTWVGLAVAGTLIGSLLAGSHKVVWRWATMEASGRLVRALVMKEIILVLALVTGLVTMPSTTLSVLCVLSDALLSALFLFYFRFAVRLFSRNEVAAVKQRANKGNVLIAGIGEDAVALARETEENGEYNVLGFLSRDREMAGRLLMDVPVYYCGDASDLERLEWRLGGVDGVLIPRSGTVRDTQAEVKVEDPVDVKSRGTDLLKRVFDVVASAVLMLVFSPMALLSAIAIKLEDGGDIIYAQERIGKDGKPFLIYKFRSMRMQAEKNGRPALYSGDDDPRLTKVGKFLRQHHLDELPQLWNVFIGDMSFIGYRPERAYYIEQIMQHNARYRYLYQIKPGITSYATLYNGYTNSMDKMLTRLDLDLYYLRNQSLWFDAKVLGLTFLSIMIGKKF